MTTHPTHRCIRCGRDVHETNAACTDCWLVDPDLIRNWRAS